MAVLNYIIAPIDPGGYDGHETDLHALHTAYATAHGWANGHTVNIDFADEGQNGRWDLSAWPTQSSYTIQPTAAYAHDGKPRATANLTNNEPHRDVIKIPNEVHLVGMHIKNNGTGQGACVNMIDTGTFGQHIDRVIAVGKGSSSGYGISLKRHIARNCLALNCETGFWAFASHYGFKAINCVAADCGAGARAANVADNTELGGMTLVNFTAYNNTTNFGSGTYYTGAGGSSNNAASDGATNAPPGANPYGSNVVAGDFVDAAIDDFHLAGGSGLATAGADASSFGVSVDIDDETITTWPIGIDQPATGGTTHDALATDIEAQADADTGAISQAHSLGAADIEAQADTDTAAASQAHGGLAAADIEAQADPDTGAVGSAADLAATDIEAQADADTGAISQAHGGLAAADIEAQADPDTGAVGSEATLLASDIEAQADADTAAASQAHGGLAAADAEAQADADTAAASQAHGGLAAADIEAQADPDNAAVTQDGTLGAADIEAQADADTGAISQAHGGLAAADIEAQADPDTGAVGSAADLAASDIEAQANADDGTVTQTHQPVAADAEGQAAMDSGAIGQVHQLGGDDIEAQAGADPAALLLDGIGPVLCTELLDVTRQTFLLDPRNC